MKEPESKSHTQGFTFDIEVEMSFRDINTEIDEGRNGGLIHKS